MARVNKVERAQKDYPEYNIKKGESYYWWKFRFGGKFYSKTPPRRSQLTQSGFLQSLYDLQDRVGSMAAETVEDLESEIDDIKGDLESLRDDCQNSLDSMPDNLREASDSGNLLQERVDGLDSWISDLENIDLSYEEDETLTAEEKAGALEDFLENAICEIQNADPGLG